MGDRHRDQKPIVSGNIKSRTSEGEGKGYEGEIVQSYRTVWHGAPQSYCTRTRDAPVRNQRTGRSLP